MTEKFKFQQIKVKYNEETSEKVKNLINLSKKLGRFKSHVRFNLHCKHNDVIPKYAKIKSSLNDPKSLLHIHKAERALLNNEISRIINKGIP